jgi:hypothetical protein
MDKIKFPVKIFLDCYKESPAAHFRSYQEHFRFYDEDKKPFVLTYSVNGLEKWVWADRSPITQLSLTALLRRHNDKTKDSI